MGVNRLADLAHLDDVPEPKQGSKEALVRVRDRARTQLEGREQDAPVRRLLEPLDADHGLALLPEPTPDDIFLDFEGNHFAEAGVQEYLTGYLARASGGEPRYRAFWATTLERERAAFEAFIDFAIETRRRNPAAHIYHFAPYEPTALKRLMGRFATREVELDELLRGEAFVDLYAVVRPALIASVERYSIKDLSTTAIDSMSRRPEPRHCVSLSATLRSLSLSAERRAKCDERMVFVAIWNWLALKPHTLSRGVLSNRHGSSKMRAGKALRVIRN